MDPKLQFLLSSGPYLSLVAAGIIRVISASQPESPWAGSARSWLIYVSYALIGISICGMALLVYPSPLLGIMGLTVAGFVAFAMADAEFRLAGTRQRARQAEFLWVMAMAVKSGRPLADEINAYAQGTWGAHHRRLMDMAERLREGAPLTEIVVPQGLIPYSATVQIQTSLGSTSLGEVLGDAAIRATQNLVDDQEKNTIRSSLVYPMALLAIVFVVVGFLMYYIIPKFKRIFFDFNTDLPEITKSLIFVSDLINNSIGVLFLPMLFIPLALLALTSFAEYHGWQAFMQTTVGRWRVRWNTPDVLRALSVRIADHEPADQILSRMAEHSGPLRLRKTLNLAIENIRSGDECWRTLQLVGILRGNEVAILENAQQTGNLPWALKTLAESIDRRRVFQTAAMFEVVRPIFLVGIAILVGFVVVAMFMPLIKLLNDLS